MKKPSQAGRKTSQSSPSKQSAKAASASAENPTPAPAAPDPNAPFTLPIEFSQEEYRKIYHAAAVRNSGSHETISLGKFIANAALKESVRVESAYPLGDLETAVQEALGFIELISETLLAPFFIKEASHRQQAQGVGIINMRDRVIKKLYSAFERSHAYAAGHEHNPRITGEG